MRSTRAFAVAFIVASLSLALHAQSAKLVAIRVTGTSEFSNDEVARASGLRLGMTAGPSDFQSAANKLGSTGAFTNVGYKYSPEGSGVAVEFNLEDAERNFPCRFENFVWASDDEMLKAIGERVPLFHGRVSESGEMLQTISDALTAWLTGKGFGGHAMFRLHAV